MKHHIALIVGLLAGCAAPVAPVVHGGSKSAGVVVLRGEYGAFKTPDIDWSAADSAALAACRDWGYKGAKSFDTHTRRCLDDFCASKEVLVRYQCTG
jgi:hypothetical protein